MTQSSEYPDLKWVSPKSWTNANRTAVQLVVIHDTEGSSHAQSAEDGAAYDSRRTDGTSAHYFVDSNSVVQCVVTADQAHTARSQGNKRGIHYELCARASFSRAQWLSADYGLPMLKLAARQAARDAKKWGIPARKLTPGQVADGVKGFCGHGDITKAFPADKGTHTDPGPDFPWDDFIDMVRAILDPPKTEDDEMSAQDVKDIKAALAAVSTKLDEQVNQVATEVGKLNIGTKTVPGRTLLAGVKDFTAGVRARLWFAPTHAEAKEAGTPQAGSVLDTLEKLPARLDKIEAAIEALKSKS